MSTRAKPSVSASKDALAAIFGKDSQKAQVGSEPPSGAQGEGTVDKPYDQGNAPAQVNSEPPSGAQGKGTVDQPFDQGNAPEQAPISNAVASSSETHQASGLPQAEPNATQTEQIKSSKSHLESVMGKKSDPPPKQEEAPAPTPAPAPASAEKTAEEPKKQDEGRGRKDWPSTRAGQQERSVSPGTLDDGSHAVTSGDKGEGYRPKGKLGNMASKVFGH